MQSPRGRSFALLVALACFAAGAGAIRRGSAASRGEPSGEGGEQGEAVDHKAFEKDWGTEWRNGEYPSFRKTVKADGYDHEAFEDSQSDGKPSPGLTGSKVGAYLPHPLPEDYPKHGE
mmetsp:Transcript_72432/g.162181  ORF Transcript_72432/g.162181 Transcript_72432/m.162181 type:complete len:118 (-) Transcript_72432:90-443(-)